MMLSLKTDDGKEIECMNVLTEAAKLLKEGNIIAVKGIGGFHLACDARNENAVKKLRERKKRKDKPFALMAKDMDVIKKVCDVSQVEEEVLQSSRMPIVLLSKKPGCDLPESAAPNMKKLGIMLPYTDIHASLFCYDLDLLVMTSGNISNSPIQYKNYNAMIALSGTADYFLTHDNDIQIPLEDSVVKVFEGKESIIRGGRGYSPVAVYIGNSSNEILALGSEQKGAFSVLKDGYAYLSRCFGGLRDMEAYEIYKYALDKLLQNFGSKLTIIAHDMHPSYITTQYASKKEGLKIPVQHHHAHMVSCMVEHNLQNKVIGVIYDGTGYGTDGAIWGGEFLIGDRGNFHRAGHFRYVNLQGGDQSVLEPWRIGLSYLDALGYSDDRHIPIYDNEKLAVVKQALKANYNCYPSSSLGRLFDCVSFLLGLCQTVTYDAQAAILLENISDAEEKGSYAHRIYKNKDRAFEIDYKEIIDGVLKDIDGNIPIQIISARFHNTICNITLDMAMKIREMSHINTVVLSGGCFENTNLLSSILNKLRGSGFDVYFNRQIPTNDSGISVGQLAAAIHREVMRCV